MRIPDRIRLLHILQAIAYIEQFLVDKQKEDLYTDPQLRFAIERQLESIGEAANHLSADLKAQYSQTEWRKIVAFRHFMAHE